MEVLFICKGNYGRSQMAEAMFDRLAGGKARACSAGADSAVAGRGRLSEAAPLVVKCMNGIGIDVSSKFSKIITREMFDKADIAVSMVETEMLPSYAQGSKKVVFWKVEDPHYMDEGGHERIRDEIYEKVARLADEIRDRGAKRSRSR